VLQTLYKTAGPFGAAIDAEFYEVFLESDLVNGRRAFFVKEKHGWWDEDKKRPVSLVTTLCPEEGLLTYIEIPIRIYRKGLSLSGCGPCWWEFLR
jgi:hypothetical protein